MRTFFHIAKQLTTAFNEASRRLYRGLRFPLYGAASVLISWVLVAPEFFSEQFGRPVGGVKLIAYFATVAVTGGWLTGFRDRATHPIRKICLAVAAAGVALFGTLTSYTIGVFATDKYAHILGISTVTLERWSWVVTALFMLALADEVLALAAIETQRRQAAREARLHTAEGDSR